MESKEIDVRYVLGMQSELGKEEPADMGYKEIKLRWGWTIKDTESELQERLIIIKNFDFSTKQCYYRKMLQIDG